MTKQLFNNFRKNPKTQITWVKEVKVEEIQITKEEIVDIGKVVG